MNDPSLAMVESLVAMAEFKDVLVAAKALGVGRTTVKRDIESLEEWSGRILFLDDGLTVDGENFARDARAVMASGTFAIEPAAPLEDVEWSLQRSERSNVRLSDLKAFAAIARDDIASYKKAADELACAEQVLRSSVTKFEAILGKRLFVGRGELRLTSYGYKLLPNINQLVAFFELLQVSTPGPETHLKDMLFRLREKAKVDLHNAQLFIWGCEHTKRLSSKNRIQLLEARGMVPNWERLIQELDSYLGSKPKTSPFEGDVPTQQVES